MQAEGSQPHDAECRLDNPARVTPAQEEAIQWLPDQRWQPLSAQPPRSGIIMCRDTRPGAPPVLLAPYPALPPPPPPPNKHQNEHSPCA